MDPIYTFGFKLAEILKQKEFAGIGLICLAVKDSGRTLDGLGYEDFKIVFQEYLPRRLQKMHFSNHEQVASEMLKTLNQNQSIFTLSSH